MARDVEVSGQFIHDGMRATFDTDRTVVAFVVFTDEGEAGIGASLNIARDATDQQKDGIAQALFDILLDVTDAGDES